MSSTYNSLVRNIFLNGRSLVIGDLDHVKKLRSKTNLSKSNTAFGTDSYNAPEVNEAKYSVKIDIW